MPTPIVTIKAQSRNGSYVTVYFRVTGLAAGGTVTVALPAAATPNGAVSRPAQTATVNAGGHGELLFTGTAAGNYAPAIVTATNPDGGTATASSMPMTVYANGTAPVGTPFVLFPAFVAPAFTAATAALDAEVTTVTLESTSASNQTNVPFTFGQPFPSGALAPGDFLVGKVVGQADVPLQFNVKSTHPNGSVRHAIISGILPSLATGTKKTISMVRAASGTSTVPSASSAITTAGLTALVNIVIGGVTYTADATPLLAAGLAASSAWIGGAVATEYSVNVPFKTAANAAHADLTAQFNVRYYPGVNAAKIDVVVEHVKAYTAISDISYTGEVKIAGVTVMTIAGSGGAALVHYPAARWKRSFWWNHASPAHIRHNVPYLLDSRQLPNWNRNTVVQESLLSGYVTALSDPNFALMGRGLFAADFGGTGGRPELGLASAWYVAAVISQDKRAKNLMLALAECAGSFSVHRRDDSTGPGAGYPMDVVHYPTSTGLGTAGDSKNYTTGGTEKLPTLTTTAPYSPDVSHQSSFSYIPYLLTGDLFHLEELHFWGNWNVYIQNCGYRSYETGLMQSEQVRGQAWSLRTMAQAAAITPDNHPVKPVFGFLTDRNLAFYNRTYTDNATANKLGVISHGGAIAYPNYSSTPRGIGNFMDDFFTQAMGHVSELGFTEASRMMLWKSKWQVSRLIGAGTCWVDACMYAPMVLKADRSGLFDTIAEVIPATVEYGYSTPLTMEALALPCNSPERMAKMVAPARQVGDLGGYPDSTEGFPANLQPALAYAVDSGYPDADIAWDLFESRTIKPDYGYGPQFSVVPRGYTAATITMQPPDVYTGVTGTWIHGGRAAPPRVPVFDSLTNFVGSANSGAPNGTTNNSLPFVLELHGSGGSNRTTGMQYRAKVSGYMAFPGTSPNLGALDYDAHDTFGFSICLSYLSDRMTIRPIDYWVNDTGAWRESYHAGFVRADGLYYLISERRYDAMMDWVGKNQTQYDLNRMCVTGGSMGGWGSASYGVRRYDKFAAVYPDRPRWSCGGTISVPQWDAAAGGTTYTQAQAPLLAPEDGGGSLYDYMNMAAYVANTANKVRWIGWSMGRQDGFTQIADSITMVDALRGAKRGFAFYWNNGGHEAGSSMDKILASYPFGTFKIGEGYPLFTDFSRDQDPRVQIAGGINIGLAFRNVVESANGWSCEVTCKTPTTTTGAVVSGSTTTAVQLPDTESEIPDVYVGGTLTIGGETRTISAYTPVGISASNRDVKTPATVTVSAAFTAAPAAGAAYSLTRPDVQCTVKVEPISEKFKKAVAKQLVTIPAANTWVPVSFS